MVPKHMINNNREFEPDSEGWLSNAVYHDSPHCDDRPNHVNISLLVVHNISLPPGQFGGGYIEKFFTGQLPANKHPYFESIVDMRVSAHCLIDRQGKLHQFVPLHKRAWHAGVSSFDGVECCNDYSIGIELEGTDELAYDKRQYETLARVSVELINCYPQLCEQRIVGHSDIAPTRKTDPGEAFDWALYRALIDDYIKKS